MSNVNKVSKNNVLYNLEDSRLYILDLGDVTSLVDGEAFQTTTSLASLQALINAEEANVKFTIEGVDAICKKIYGASYVDGSTTYYRAFATFFMQGEENAYTTYTIQIVGTSESQTAQVSGFLINQTIPTSGGGGDGATIIEKTGLADWEDGMQMFDANSDEYNAWENDDLVYIKFTPYNTSYTYMIPRVSNEDVAMGVIMTEGYLYMAIILEEDDSYMGMVMQMTINEALHIPTIYKHEVNLTFSNQGNPTNAKLIILTPNGETYSSAGDVWDELQRDGTALNVKYLFEKDTDQMFECIILGIYDGYYNSNQYAQLVLMDNPEGSGITKRDWDSYTFVNDQVSELQ